MSRSSLAAVLAALLALTAATVAAAHVDLGRPGTPVALGIASAKALLVVLFFMHVRRASPLVRLASGAALVWLAILFALVFADYATR